MRFFKPNDTAPQSAAPRQTSGTEGAAAALRSRLQAEQEESKARKTAQTATSALSAVIAEAKRDYDKYIDDMADIPQGSAAYQAKKQLAVAAARRGMAAERNLSAMQNALAAGAICNALGTIVNLNAIHAAGAAAISTTLAARPTPDRALASLQEAAGVSQDVDAALSSDGVDDSVDLAVMQRLERDLAGRH